MPQPPPYVDRAFGAAPDPGRPVRRRRPALVAVATVLVLGLGGCLAAGVLVWSRVEQNAADTTYQDRLGGPDHPLVISEGEPFDVYGFEYAAGWQVVADPIGNASVAGLRVTNDRDRPHRLYATIRLVAGHVVDAQLLCYANDSRFIAVGESVEVGCSSTDPLPQSWDRVTIRDTF